MKNKKLFSKEQTQTHDIYRIFGMKLAVRNKKREYKETKASKYIQDTLDLSKLQNNKKIIVFLIPADTKINGGIMSIFSLCQTTRKICDNAYCLLSTYPNGKTYIINDKFYNNEIILRFDQIVNNAKNAKEMILHIPECYADDFYKDLNVQDLKFLKSIPNLQINILNQNIEIMPEPEKLQDLYKLTKNITQTVAHNRYATQEVCDKWQIPTHLFSVNIDLSKYKAYSFEQKEKIIVLSPDVNEHKEKIVNKLKKELPDWKLVTVKNLTFSQYMDLISRALFTITFGEGFDGYFLQPQYVGSIGFAVYNNEFFPNKDWLNLSNVYKNYSEMEENIVLNIQRLYKNKDLYIETQRKVLDMNNKLYQFDKFKNNLERFYDRQYDFLPDLKEVNNAR